MRFIRHSAMCFLAFQIVATVAGQHPRQETRLAGVLRLESLDMADRLFSEGRLADAETAYRAALRAAERAGDRVLTARVLTSLGRLLNDVGRFDEAEQLGKRAVELCDAHSEASRGERAIALGLLAFVRLNRGDLAQAEELVRSAIQLAEEALGSSHRELGAMYSILSRLYLTRNELGLAEPLARRALAILEKAVGRQHPETAILRQNLATIYLAERKCGRAERLTREVLATLEDRLGTLHPDVVRSRSILIASLYCGQKLDEAEPLLAAAMRDMEVCCRDQPFNSIPLLLTAAGIHQGRSRYGEAAAALSHAIRIWRESGAKPHHLLLLIASYCVQFLNKRKSGPEVEQLHQELSAALGPKWRETLKMLSHPTQGSSYLSTEFPR
jgi:tetratricopeptide (TPR) repeat protein